MALSSNVYRMTRHCSNCPWKDDGRSIGLREGRVDEIKKELLESDQNSFNCHKTVYNLDEEMSPTEKQKPKMCYGAFKFLQENNRSNIQMRLAYSMGIDEPLEEEE